MLVLPMEVHELGSPAPALVPLLFADKRLRLEVERVVAVAVAWAAYEEGQREVQPVAHCVRPFALTKVFIMLLPASPLQYPLQPLSYRANTAYRTHSPGE